MTSIADKIWNNVTESISAQMGRIVEYAGTAIVVAILFLFAYVIGSVIAEALRRILKSNRIEDIVIKNGIMRSKAWEDTIKFLMFYVTWYTVISILTLTGSPLITGILYPLMNNLSGFLLLVLTGLIVGSMISKFIRDMSMDFGWEDKLVKYGLADALGDISITSLLTGFVKWYIVLLFVNQGINQFENMTVLSKFINDLMDYIPQAILGSVVMIVALMIADYTGDRIKQRKLGFAETLAFCVESIIVFFGAVIALPHFGVTNVSILEDSFKILMIGVSLALAIAAGLGLKDFVGRVAQKQEKEMMESKKI